MAISGVGSDYSNVYGSTYTAQKNEAVKKTETKKAAPAQAKNTGTDSVSDYYSYLQKNYDCVKNGSVAISGSYLKECARNPEKAKELEESLAYFKEGYENGLKSAQTNARAIGARVVNYSESWSIDSTGNITMMASTTVTSDSGVKGWKELAEEREEKLKEKKEQEHTEEKRKEQKEQEEELLEKIQISVQAMKDIRSQYGDSVIVEFSGDGMAALAEGRKGWMVPEDKKAMEARNAAFQKNIVQIDKSLNNLPAYSGMYGADKAVASALENCGKEEQGFVYDIIRQNFLVGNSGSMTEEERQANISLGMKKAEYAAENFIPEDSRKSFMEAMESIAKLASAGKADSSGNMDYGVAKGRYLGHGSNLVQTTNALDMMRTMDKDAYAEYQKMGEKDDGGLSSLKYLTNWYAGAVKKNPSMIDNYEKQSEEYVEKNVKNQKLDKTFEGLKTGSKAAFFESLRMFQSNNPNFLSFIINRELASKFWGF